MPRFIDLPQEKIDRARELYENTLVPRKEIADMLGVCVATLERRINLWNWSPRQARPLGKTPPTRRTRRHPEPAPAELLPAIPPDAPLVRRVRAAVEREVAAIEAVLARTNHAGLRSTDAERAARTLATLVRTLREIAALERDESGEANDGEGEDEFRDLEEFRRELIGRLDKIRARNADRDAGT